MPKNNPSKHYNILMVIPKQKATKEEDYTYIFPLGITYISAVLKEAGYNVDCLNMNHKIGNPEDIINEQLNKKDYDFVGTGSITTAYQVMKKIIDTVKAHKSRPKVILGGLIITSEPQTIFKLLEPDYAVIGEGEETILELLEAIKNKKDLKKIKGIEFKDETGKLILTETRMPHNDLDKIPYPDYEGFEFDKFLDNLHPNSHDYIYSAFDHPRVYSIMGSRGCPFNCTFCYHYNRYRKRSIDSIMKELESMVPKYKTNIILFYDECIAADKDRLTELCKRMTELRAKTPWEIKWYPQLTVHNIDDETLKMMKDAGVAGVSYGFESFSPTVLKSMNKPITPQMIESAFKKTMNAGLTMQANFIFGDSAETMDTAMETLNWWKQNAKGQIHLLFIQPYAGSKIYERALDRGIIKNKEEFISNVVPFSSFNLTDKMTDKEMDILRKEVLKSTAEYSSFAVPKLTKIKEKIYDLEVKCPYCKEKFTYGNCHIENKYTFAHILPCRKCGMLFYIVSTIAKIGYKNYVLFRSIRDLQKKVQRKIEELRLKL